MIKRGSITLWAAISAPELCHRLSVSFLYPEWSPNGAEEDMEDCLMSAMHNLEISSDSYHFYEGVEML